MEERKVSGLTPLGPEWRAFFKVLIDSQPPMRPYSPTAIVEYGSLTPKAPMTREEYEAAIAARNAELAAEKARVFGGRAAGVDVVKDEAAVAALPTDRRRTGPL